MRIILNKLLWETRGNPMLIIYNIDVLCLSVSRIFSYICTLAGVGRDGFHGWGIKIDFLKQSPSSVWVGFKCYPFSKKASVTQRNRNALP